MSKAHDPLGDTCKSFERAARKLDRPVDTLLGMVAP